MEVFGRSTHRDGRRTVRIQQTYKGWGSASSGCKGAETAEMNEAQIEEGTKHQTGNARHEVPR